MLRRVNPKILLLAFLVLMLSALGSQDARIRQLHNECEAQPTATVAQVSIIAPTATAKPIQPPVCIAATPTKQFIQPALPTIAPATACKTEPAWIELPGEWVVTHYGLNDGTEGEKHGAAWRGLTCPDYAALTTDMPDVVTLSHYGGAMPGVAFYCMPVKLCVGEKCAVFTAVDVPRDYEIAQNGHRYNHADVWYQVAHDLGIVDAGIVYGVKVYLGQRQP